VTAVEKPGPHDMDEPVAIPIDPEDTLKALLKADPDAKPVPQDEPVGRIRVTRSTPTARTGPTTAN
jgi:hypothetical protein